VIPCDGYHIFWPGLRINYPSRKFFREIAMKTVMPEIAMKNVIITATVIGTLLFGTVALLFAIATETAAVSTVQQHHYGSANSARHASLPPLW
jgi:hypothetical protein